MELSDLLRSFSHPLRKVLRTAAFGLIATLGSCLETGDGVQSDGEPIMRAAEPICAADCRALKNICSILPEGTDSRCVEIPLSDAFLRGENIWWDYMSGGESYACVSFDPDCCDGCASGWRTDEPIGWLGEVGGVIRFLGASLPSQYRGLSGRHDFYERQHVVPGDAVLMMTGERYVSGNCRTRIVLDCRSHPSDYCTARPDGDEGPFYEGNGSWRAFNLTFGPCGENLARVIPILSVDMFGTGGCDVRYRNLHFYCCGEGCDTLRDFDGDGYGDGPGAQGYDCNDNDENVHPEAPDPPSGQDMNCHVEANETYSCHETNTPGSEGDGAPPPVCSCPDTDGDGHYSPSCRNADCGPLDDCNNSNHEAHPGAPEICNGMDENCNGSIDEGLYRYCTNECGNEGTQACESGSWETCRASPCPSDTGVLRLYYMTPGGVTASSICLSHNFNGGWNANACCRDDTDSITCDIPVRSGTMLDFSFEYHSGRTSWSCLGSGATGSVNGTVRPTWIPEEGASQQLDYRPVDNYLSGCNLRIETPDL